MAQAPSWLLFLCSLFRQPPLWRHFLDFSRPQEIEVATLVCLVIVSMNNLR